MTMRTAVVVPLARLRDPSRPSFWRDAQVLCLGLLMACAGSAAHGRAPQVGNTCPPATYDYGNGMVASLPPVQVTEALRQARDGARKSTGERLSTLLAEQPWRPHVSVICGVSREREPIVYGALQALADGHRGTVACFGRVQHGDDDVGSSMTLVLNVRHQRP